MRKRILLIAGLVVVLAGTFVLLHKQFSSTTIAMGRSVDTVDSVITHSIKYSELADFSANNPGDHVFLIRDANTDSDYIIETLLTPLSKEHDVKTIPSIVSVDLSDAKDLTVTRLKNMFGVESYPAIILANFDSTKNTLNVKNSIVYDAQSPFTIDSLRAWFFNNNLWSGPYNE